MNQGTGAQHPFVTSPCDRDTWQFHSAQGADIHRVLLKVPSIHSMIILSRYNGDSCHPHALGVRAEESSFDGVQLFKLGAGILQH